MVCPRCGSNSIVREHDAVNCIACGHALSEPVHDAWDVVSASRRVGANLGPPVTSAERLAWQQERRG